MALALERMRQVPKVPTGVMSLSGFLLMGGKSSAEVVRHGADKAVVSCVFESTANAEAILEENGLDSGGSEVILRREILSTGKGRVFVNNQPATVAVLRQLAPELALVHAQSETPQLLRPGPAARAARPLRRRRYHCRV